jgi:hypothetical protein
MVASLLTAVFFASGALQSLRREEGDAETGGKRGLDSRPSGNPGVSS